MGKISIFLCGILFFFGCKDQVADQSAALKPVFTSSQVLTAGQIVDRIKEEVTCDWSEKTVDTFKGGDPNTPVTGIATTFMATMDVLKKAKAQGLNFIITHEPTFYNHFDDTGLYGQDAVISAKQAFIKENGLVVWRFHDHIHQTEPDGIYEGMISKLGWKGKQIKEDAFVFRLPQTTLKDLALQMKDLFQSNAIRVVGDREMSFTTVALVAGAPGSARQIKMLQNEEVEVILCGETREWETVEYVRDAVSQGKKKALVLLGHANSEEAGMVYCADWLGEFVKEVPIRFLPAGDPFWTPL